MKKVFIVCASALILSGCSDKPIESFKVVCTGKFTSEQKSTNWSAPVYRNHEYSETYEVVKDWFSDNPKDKSKYWRVNTDTQHSYSSPDLPGKPSGWREVYVGSDLVRVHAEGQHDYENTNKDAGLNQKSSWVRHMTINRLNGEWQIHIKDKTEWKDGTVMREDSYVNGTCKKAEQKF